MTETPGDENLTLLTVDVHTREDGSRSAGVSFLVNVRQTLMPDFEAAAHDTVLRVLHRRGLMPVGPLLVLTDTLTREDLDDMIGDRGASSMEALGLAVETTNGNIVKVSADVELGVSLD